MRSISQDRVQQTKQQFKKITRSSSDRGGYMDGTCEEVECVWTWTKESTDEISGENYEYYSVLDWKKDIDSKQSIVT